MSHQVRVQRVSKRFGTSLALHEVNATFSPGSIHAVLGENGAGKSTLMGVLGGFIRPDSGEVLVGDTRLPLGHPMAVRQFGIELVHQHFMLVPAFTVAANLALSSRTSLTKRAAVEIAIDRAAAVAKSLGWPLRTNALAGSLPVGEQQRHEIIKALVGDAHTLILDEPTAVLSMEEVDDLFTALRRLREQGKCIILIAHKLDEVLRVADEVTVLRHGRNVAHARIEDVDASKLTQWMVGELEPSQPKPARTSGAPVIQARELTVLGDRGNRAVDVVTFDVRSGEVLAVGGVDGNGQVELAECVAGVREFASGDLRTSPSVAYVPQDRQRDGLSLEMSIFENLMITGCNRPELRLGPLIRIAQARAWAQRMVEHYQVRTKSIDARAGSLSGGNQQKIVVARALDSSPKALVAVNPSRGLDVQATQYVHEQVEKVASDGAGVLLFSTDRSEVSEVGDRSVIMSRGRFDEVSPRTEL